LRIKNKIKNNQGTCTKT